MSKSASVRGSMVSAPLAVLAMALLPSILLARCGIWPTFPPRDGGMDGGGMDGGARDGVVGTNDRADIATDVFSPEGFRVCPTAPGLGPFTAVSVASLTGTVFANDLAFDGRMAFVTVSDQVQQVTAVGAVSGLTTVTSPLNGYGIRYLANGDIVFATFSVTAGATGNTITRFEPSTGMVTQLASGLTNAHGVVSMPGAGGVFFTQNNSGVGGLFYVTLGGAMTQLTAAIPSPTGLAFAPDYRHLYVGSAGMGVYVVEVLNDGTLVGTPRMYAASLVKADSLAFDQCGYLYAADKDRNRIMRVSPGGGAIDTLVVSAPGAMAFSPWGLAFGRGAGFDPNSLYALDVNSNTVLRIPIGVPGAAIVLPP